MRRMRDAYYELGPNCIQCLMKRTLVLLGPVPVGVFTTFVIEMLVYPTALFGYSGQLYGFAWGLFLFFVVLYTSIFILLSYGAVLVYNVAGILRERKVPREKLVLISPLLFGITLTLLGGLVANYLASDPEDTLYFNSYGFPFYWRWTPTDTCAANGQRFALPLQCEAGFSGSSFLYNVLFYTGFFLWLSYISILVYNAIPLFKNKNKKWPVFLPKVSVRDGTVRTGPAKQKEYSYSQVRP